mmetsp:Transcript_17920/g.36001  ORF Transcript_17920/g.36001 Transcript_17920/m.36001 type:complete len:834 (+) Transcript_17920:3-2504(+)
MMFDLILSSPPQFRSRSFKSSFYLEMYIVCVGFATMCDSIKAHRLLRSKTQFSRRSDIDNQVIRWSIQDIAFVHHSTSGPYRPRIQGSQIPPEITVPSSRNRRGHHVSSEPLLAKRPEQPSKSDETSNTEGDLPAWLKALIRWEVPESATESDVLYSHSLNGGNKIWDNEMSPLVASLSGMMNVEALVAAAANTTENGKTAFSDLKFLGDGNNEKDEAIPESKVFPFLENALRWDQFVPLLQKNMQELRTGDDTLNENATATTQEISAIIGDVVELIQENDSPSGALGGNDTNTKIIAAEKILRDATQRLEYIINGTSSAFSPSAIQDLVLRAGNALALQEASGNLTAAANAVFSAAGKAPRATAQYTAELIQFANGVLSGGYIDEMKSGIIEKSRNPLAKPLFSKFPSVKKIPDNERMQSIFKGTEFATLSGAIYENTVPIVRSLNHGIVAQGVTAGIAWMVTDSLQYEQDFAPSPGGTPETRKPTLVRTFVLRGYDASDKNVDRVGLLNTICTAAPVPIRKKENTIVSVHEGMLSIARELLAELQKFIDFSAPDHKIALCGHSIGGSLSLLLLALLVNSRGADFVKQKVIRVFTYGSPPIFLLKKADQIEEKSSILETFGLPDSIAFGYNQPWDPISRLFSEFDPLYPLIDDLGEDGVTLYASGPPRTLRPITKAILESWEGWPSYRDNAREKLGQHYRNVGKQYLLLPELSRYLTDRLVAVNTAVPPVDVILEVAPEDLLPSLNEVFTLDVFTISYIPVAIRSFVHHFYPAYGLPFRDYAEKLRRPNPVDLISDPNIRLFERGSTSINANGNGWTEVASQFVLGGSFKVK